MESEKRRLEGKVSDRRNHLIKRKREQPILSTCKKRFSGNAMIMDNGAYSIKVGYNSSENPQFLPNHIMKAKSERKRCFIADQIEDCRDLSGLFYITAHDHGYITKYDVQKTIWDYTFHKFPLDDSTLIMTQPILNFRHVQEYMDEIFFEEYDVKSMYRANATDLSRYQYINEDKGSDTPCIIVDSGYSFTHIVPYINGMKYSNAIIRMNIGGKLLTNYLKDILSYRQLHVMEETYVINQVKEDTCFMSQNFKEDMRRAKISNEIVKNYVLPDFHNIRRGYVQESDDLSDLAENCQILRLNNERMSVPEILMKPSIIPGLEQAGLAQCISTCISRCPAEYRKALANNIVLTGGNCMFPGFRERLETETRMFVPCHHKLSVYQAEDPRSYSWQGGKSLSSDADLKLLSITKQEYDEYGSNYTYKKFNQYCTISEDKPKEKNELMFSYLDHWKNEGVDLFSKKLMTHVSNDSDVEFILEGDGIEELDGKYVTIDFEYNKECEEKSMSVKEIKRDEDSADKLIKKKRMIRTDVLPPDSTSQEAVGTSLNENVTEVIENLDTANPFPKVYKPIFRNKTELKVVEPAKVSQMTQILRLSQPVTLNGSSIIVPNVNAKTVTLNSGQLLNNTVILPPNLLASKNVMIIDFRPEMLRQAGNIIIAKKS